MSSIMPRGAGLAVILSAALILLGATIAEADPNVSVIPSNAHKSGFSGAWQCDAGFRRSKNACIKVTVPKNAYTTDASYG